MDINEESFAVLYSHSQKLFHIDTIRDMIRKNNDAYAAGQSIDWVVMNIVENRQLASSYIDKYKRVINGEQNN